MGRRRVRRGHLAQRLWRGGRTRRTVNRIWRQDPQATATNRCEIWLELFADQRRDQILQLLLTEVCSDRGPRRSARRTCWSRGSERTIRDKSNSAASAASACELCAEAMGHGGFVPDCFQCRVRHSKGNEILMVFGHQRLTAWLRLSARVLLSPYIYAQIWRIAMSRAVILDPPAPSLLHQICFEWTAKCH